MCAVRAVTLDMDGLQHPRSRRSSRIMAGLTWACTVRRRAVPSNQSRKPAYARPSNCHQSRAPRNTRMIEIPRSCAR